MGCRSFFMSEYEDGHEWNGKIHEEQDRRRHQPVTHMGKGAIMIAPFMPWPDQMPTPPTRVRVKPASAASAIG